MGATSASPGRGPTSTPSSSTSLPRATSNSQLSHLMRTTQHASHRLPVDARTAVYYPSRLGCLRDTGRALCLCEPLLGAFQPLACFRRVPFRDILFADNLHE